MMSIVWGALSSRYLWVESEAKRGFHIVYNLGLRTGAVSMLSKIQISGGRDIRDVYVLSLK
jgi:hypothetical protein